MHPDHPNPGFHFLFYKLIGSRPGVLQSDIGHVVIKPAAAELASLSGTI